MNGFAERERLFNQLYDKAIEKVDNGWCYVGEASIQFHGEKSNDFEGVKKILSTNKTASDCWEKYVETNNFDYALNEVHSLPAIALSIAIKVFVCSDVEILLGFETSKYSDGEVDYWWAISPIANQGVELSSENKYKSYLSHLKKGKEFVVEDGDFEIVDGTLEAYNGTETDIVIPERVNKIGNYAFNYSDISSVFIPDSVKKIEYNAFSYCKNLISVKLPQKIKMIDDHTFYNCIKLTSIEIPNGVTKIGSNAFTNCSSLQSVTLPDTVTEIKSEAFYGCSNLNTITVPENLVKLGKKVFAGNYSGQCRSLSKVIPSKNVKTFKNSSLELVWNQICKELKPFSEVIARILTFWLSDYNELIKDEDSVVKKIKTLKNEILDYCIQTDDDIALNNLLAIIKLKIDEIDNYIEIANSKGSTKTCAILLEYNTSNFSKKQISNYYKKVTKIALDKNDRSVADWKKIFDYETADDGLIITRYKGEETIVEIPAFIGKNRVVAITNYIFEYNRIAKELILPNDEVVYSRDAFSKYQVSIIESSNCEDNKINVWKIKTLKDGTVKLVYYCRYDAENVEIPKSIDGKKVTILGTRLFSGHEEIRFVDVSDNITEIETECFLGCYGLEKVNLSDGLKTIGSMAFRYCGLKILDIPISVEKICGGALDGAENVIVRGNPTLVKNLTIFRMKSNVYAKPDTEVYRYCEKSLGASSWFKVKVFPLSDVPEKF